MRTYKSKPRVKPYGKFKAVVQGDLALTPSKMYECMKRGIPISAQADMALQDGPENPSWDVDLRERGLDIADVYMREQDARAKLVKHMQNDINTYGE